jgi:hypothetical protein
MDIVSTSHVLPARAEVYLRVIAPNGASDFQEIPTMKKLILALALATVGPLAANAAPVSAHDALIQAINAAYHTSFPTSTQQTARADSVPEHQNGVNDKVNASSQTADNLPNFSATHETFSSHQPTQAFGGAEAG